MANLKNPFLKNINSGEIIEIVKSPFTIGRGLNSDYVIKSKVVSRIHCSLEKTENGWVLDDLSTNGTMVNDDLYKATRSSVLKKNDEICLGFQTYTYKFMIDTEKIPNLQVEKLKAEDICLASKNCLSPSSPSSFDEEGVSDEVLNNLADDILHNVEEKDVTNESNEAYLQHKPPTMVASPEFEDLLDKQHLSATTTFNNIEQASVLNFPEYFISKKNNQSLYPCDKIIDPIKAMLRESPPNIIDQTESPEHTNSYSDIFKIIMGATNLSQNGKERPEMAKELIEQENNNPDIPGTNLQTETSDSLTVNNNLPISKEILNILPTVIEENTNCKEREISNNIATCSLLKEQSTNSNNAKENEISNNTVTCSLFKEQATITSAKESEISNNTVNCSLLKEQSTNSYNAKESEISNNTVTCSLLKEQSTNSNNNKENEISNNTVTCSLLKEQSAVTNAKENEISNSTVTSLPKEQALKLPVVQKSNKISNPFAAITEPAVSAEQILDPVERFKINFAATLDDVVKKYTVDLDSVISEHSNVTTANRDSILTTSGTTPLRTYSATVQPTHSLIQTNQNIPSVSSVSVASCSNSFKKLKVMTATPITSLSSVWQPIMGTNISGIRLPNNSNIHRVIIIKPQVSGANSLVQNTVGAREQSFQPVGATPQSNNPQSYLTSMRTTLNSTIVSPLIKLPASYVPSNTTSLASNPIANQSSYVLANTTSSVSNPIANQANYVLANTTSSASNHIANQADIINTSASSLSVANHGINATIDNHELNNTKVELGATYKDSQEPSTSKEAEKLPSNKAQNQGFDQKQFEEMEDELMCTICANLFIKAVVLGCSHSFCLYCIEQWKKKKLDCPICRTKITSSIRTLVLDNLIEKMLENSSLEDRQQREEAVQERNKIEETENASKKKQNSNRRNRNRARREQAAARVSPLPPPPPVVDVVDLVDSPSTTDNEPSDYDFDDYDYDDYSGDEWYNGRPGAYFGGYGRCYNCGDRGHWANGCPYR